MAGDFSWHPDPGLVDLTREDSARDLAQLGEAAWSMALEWLQDEALKRPVGPDSYPEARARFFGDEGAPSPAPDSPAPWKEVLDEFRLRVGPGTYNSQHPGSFAYFTPPPLPMSIAGEVLAQWANQGVDVFHGGPTAAFVEEEVTRWLCDLIGFGPESWGVLTSGGVMANIMALAVARDIHLRKLRELGLPPRGSELDGVRIYVSDQAHFSIGRGVDLLGFPRETLHVVPSDERFKLLPDRVAAAIEEDQRAGLTPLAIAAVAGTTNTGSVDALIELGELSAEQGLWYHIDAAYGGAAMLSERDAGRVVGLETADSVTVDPHKWFFQAYDIGGLVVRDRTDLHNTFRRTPEYYRSNRPEDQPLHWFEYSMEGTRRMRALKFWLSWKHMGTTGFGKLVEANDTLAEYLATLIQGADDFDLAVWPELSIVCFRHLPSGHASMKDADLDDYQTRLQRALEVSGRAWVSTTVLRGRTFLRAGVMNYYASEEEADELLRALRDLSEGVLEEMDI